MYCTEVCCKKSHCNIEKILNVDSNSWSVEPREFWLAERLHPRHRMRDVHRNPLTNLHWHVIQPGCRVRMTYYFLGAIKPLVNISFRLCFVKLKLLLLALEVRPDDGGDTKISINPRGSKIPANTVGFFIAGDCMEVRTIIFIQFYINLDINFMKRWKELGTTAKPATKMWRTRTRSRSASVKIVGTFLSLSLS